MARAWPALWGGTAVLGALAIGLGAIGGLSGILVTLAMGALPVLLILYPAQRRVPSRPLGRLGLGLLAAGAALMVIAATASLALLVGVAGAALYAGGLLLLQRPPER